MAAKGVAKTLSNALLLGTCVPSIRHNASKIRVRRLEFDTFLLMYFNKYDFFIAHDPQKICRAGDVVLIKELPTKLTTTITHEVLEVVYPFGDVTDPITGKKVVVNRYRYEEEELESKYGKLPTAFDYSKAPPRGWQEGKKDFANQDTYIKYHEFPDEDQPYAVEPKYYRAPEVLASLPKKQFRKTLNWDYKPKDYTATVYPFSKKKK